MKKLIVALCLTSFVTAAEAATYTYNGLIKTIRNDSGSTYPGIDSAATVELEIDDSNPALVIDGMAFDPAPIIRARVNSPGFFSADLSYADEITDPTFTFLSFDGTGLRYEAYSPSTVVNPNPLAEFLPEGLNVLSLTFGSPGASPTTIAELIAAIEAPGLSGSFNFEAEDLTTGFDQIEVRFESGVVPLPASLLLLLSSVLFLSQARRKPA